MTRTLHILQKDTNNKDVKTTLTHVNTNASAADLKAFTILLNGLTTNTYVDTLMTDVTSLNEATA